MERSQDVLEVATLAGELLLKNGAEISRIEGTMGHILEAYGVKDYHVYALSNGIFATVNETGPDHCSALRNVSQEEVNLQRIEAVNHISREISRGGVATWQARRMLLDCQRLGTGWPLLVAATGVGAGAFCYLAGGSLIDGVLAVPIGILLRLFLIFVGRYHLPKLVTVVLASAIATCLGASIVCLVAGTSFDNMVIGSIVPLVPGVAFTTGIRDLFNSHYLSGCIHLLDALLTGVCIALGVGVSVFLFVGVGGVAL